MLSIYQKKIQIQAMGALNTGAYMSRNKTIYSENIQYKKIRLFKKRHLHSSLIYVKIVDQVYQI